MENLKLVDLDTAILSLPSRHLHNINLRYGLDRVLASVVALESHGYIIQGGIYKTDKPKPVSRIHYQGNIFLEFRLSRAMDGITNIECKRPVYVRCGQNIYKAPKFLNLLYHYHSLSLLIPVTVDEYDIDLSYSGILLNLDLRKKFYPKNEDLSCLTKVGEMKPHMRVKFEYIESITKESSNPSLYPTLDNIQGIYDILINDKLPDKSLLAFNLYHPFVPAFCPFNDLLDLFPEIFQEPIKSISFVISDKQGKEGWNMESENKVAYIDYHTDLMYLVDNTCHRFSKIHDMFHPSVKSPGCRF